MSSKIAKFKHCCNTGMDPIQKQWVQNFGHSIISGTRRVLDRYSKEYWSSKLLNSRSCVQIVCITALSQKSLVHSASDNKPCTEWRNLKGLFLHDAAAVASGCHKMSRQRRNSKSSKQQLHLQSKLIIAGLCATLVLALVLAWSLSSLEQLVSTVCWFVYHFISCENPVYSV